VSDPTARGRLAADGPMPYHPRNPNPEERMRKAALYLAAALSALTAPAAHAQGANAAVSIGASDLGGVVTGRNGPEAGVWVIAETTDLPTRFRKIVVTDDRGRYLIPELPRPITASGSAATGLRTRPKSRPSPASS